MKDPLPTLINLAREAFMEQVRPLLRKYDLTDQQWRTMKALYMLGDLDAAELAENASLRKPSLSRVIRQLGDRKLLTPVRDKNDRRRVISRLTKKGETICLELGPNMEACLSGYHPHPLYVVCLLGLQARAGAGALRRRSG